MKELQIIDIIGTPEAIIRPFGEKVAERVSPYIEAGEPVCLSFEGLNGVVGSFLRASIGELYRTFGKEKMDSLLTYAHLNRPVWQSLLKDTIDLATNPEMAQAHEDALAHTLSL